MNKSTFSEKKLALSDWNPLCYAMQELQSKYPRTLINTLLGDKISPTTKEIAIRIYRLIEDDSIKSAVFTKDLLAKNRRDSINNLAKTINPEELQIMIDIITKKPSERIRSIIKQKNKPISECNPSLNIENFNEDAMYLEVFREFLDDQKLEELKTASENITELNKTREEDEQKPYMTLKTVHDLKIIIDAEYYFGLIKDQNGHKDKIEELVSEYLKLVEILIRCSQKEETRESYERIGKEYGIDKKQIINMHQKGSIRHSLATPEQIKSFEVTSKNHKDFAYILGVMFSRYGIHHQEKERLNQMFSSDLVFDASRRYELESEDKERKMHITTEFVQKFSEALTQVINKNVKASSSLRLNHLPLMMEISKQTNHFNKIPFEYIASQDEIVAFLKGMFECGYNVTCCAQSSKKNLIHLNTANLGTKVINDLMFLCSKIKLYPLPISNNQGISAKLSFADQWNAKGFLKHDIIGKTINPHKDALLNSYKDGYKKGNTTPIALFVKITEFVREGLSEEIIINFISTIFKDYDLDEKFLLKMIRGQNAPPKKSQTVMNKLDEINTQERKERYEIAMILKKLRETINSIEENYVNIAVPWQMRMEFISLIKDLRVKYEESFSDICLKKSIEEFASRHKIEINGILKPKYTTEINP